MANPEHIQWLLEAADSWNERREKLGLQGIHFTLDFKEANLWEVFLKAGKLEKDIYHPELGYHVHTAVWGRHYGC